ncbi:MAG: DUF169 domain-containing protein, partial [Methanobacterium sp.]|nr:DUF169 domain-containing protein [Methanobacterium sp.]
KGSPVAVKLVKSADEIPAGYFKMNEKKRHCEFVQNSRINGNKGYATSAEHLCKGGAGVMGIEPLPESVATGKMYHQLGNYDTAEGAMETVSAVPKLSKEYYASIYSPLESAEFEPDVIIIVLTPKQALRVSQAYLRLTGGRISSDYSGIQSLCADAVAAVVERGVPNMTLGCSGSRKYAEIADEEVIMGIPTHNISEIVDALKTFKEKWGEL